MPDNIFTLNCELCKGGHHEEKIILCDRCDRGCHLFCLSPPLEQVPEGEWLCPMCKAEDAHGFVEGQQYSLDEFEKTASAFKKNFFGGQAAAKKVSAVQHTPIYTMHAALLISFSLDMHWNSRNAAW